MPSLAELALSFVIEFSDPKTTIAPMQLMRCSKFLHAKGSELGRDNVVPYLTTTLVESVEPGMGLRIGGNAEFVNALYMLLRTRLPGGLGNFGPSCSIAVPIRVDETLLNPANSPQHNRAAVQIHTCREYRQRTWRRGVMHGPSLVVHTCNTNSIVSEVQVYSYYRGCMHGTSFCLTLSPPETPTNANRLEITRRRHLLNVLIEEKRAVVSAGYCTRAWRQVCKADTEWIRRVYETFFRPDGHMALFTGDPLAALWLGYQYDQDMGPAPYF